MRLGVLLGALAVGAIFSVYAWLRVAGTTPSVAPSSLALSPAERRVVATLPDITPSSVSKRKPHAKPARGSGRSATPARAPRVARPSPPPAAPPPPPESPPPPPAPAPVATSTSPPPPPSPASPPPPPAPPPPATTTTTSKPAESKPGHGWGDRNHTHTGPPGQNKKR